MLLLALQQPMLLLDILLLANNFCFYRKMVLEKLSKTTMVAFLDDRKMTKNLAEFLLQLQGGLSQGSTSAGSFIPRGSVLHTSNFDVPERWYLIVVVIF